MGRVMSRWSRKVYIDWGRMLMSILGLRIRRRRCTGILSQHIGSCLQRSYSCCCSRLKLRILLHRMKAYILYLHKR